MFDLVAQLVNLITPGNANPNDMQFVKKKRMTPGGLDLVLTVELTVLTAE